MSDALLEHELWFDGELMHGHDDNPELGSELINVADKRLPYEDDTKPASPTGTPEHGDSELRFILPLHWLYPEDNEFKGDQLELGDELADITDKQLLHKDDGEHQVVG